MRTGKVYLKHHVGVQGPLVPPMCHAQSVQISKTCCISGSFAHDAMWTRPVTEQRNRRAVCQTKNLFVLRSALFVGNLRTSCTPRASRRRLILNLGVAGADHSSANEDFVVIDVCKM